MDTVNSTSNRSNSYLNVYDAVWSIAFVLDNSRSELQKQGKILENLTYGDANATDVFRRKAQKLDFKSPNVGVSEIPILLLLLLFCFFFFFLNSSSSSFSAANTAAVASFWLLPRASFFFFISLSSSRRVCLLQVAILK